MNLVRVQFFRSFPIFDFHLLSLSKEKSRDLSFFWKDTRFDRGFVNDLDVTWRTTLLGLSGNASISEDFCSVTEITGWNRVKTISRNRRRNGRAKTVDENDEDDDGRRKSATQPALCNCLGDGNRETRMERSLWYRTTVEIYHVWVVNSIRISFFLKSRKLRSRMIDRGGS